MSELSARGRDSGSESSSSTSDDEGNLDTDQRESGPFLIQSYNFPSYAFGLRNPNHQEAYINCNIDSNHNKFKFYVVTPGLTGQPGTISFKSTDPDRPNHYLRHRNFLLYLDPESSASLYKNDASFWLCSNKYFHDYIAFESVNFPNHFIRHQDYRLKISPEDNTALMHEDASFIFVEGKKSRKKTKDRRRCFHCCIL